MQLKFFYAAVIFLAVACGDSPKERTDGFSRKNENPADSLFQEVMHGHDTAMAKMGKLAGFRKQVEQKIDSLGKKGGAAKESLKSSLNDLGKDLKDAENSMNEWMEEFSIDSAQNDVERRIEYLKSEKIKVDDVKAKILQTLERADSLLRR